ncbi:cystathionine beta-lyase [Brucellaceae bacterium C25G]
MTPKDTPKNLGINTRLVRDGYNPRDYHGFVNPPVVRASTVLFPNAESMIDGSQKYTYGTRGTPTTDALCRAIDELEGSEGTVCVPSGLAAVTVPLLAFLSPGDHVLFVDSIYNPTRHFADTMLKRMGVEVEYYAPNMGAEIEKLIKANTKVIFTESPASNTFEVQDIPAIVKAAHKHDVVVMMDNTWATPVYFRALDYGVDISIHASTKYPSGHSDILFGTISANKRCWPQLLETHGTLGLCVSGDDAYQVLRGLRTMGIRLEHHQKSAITIAEWLDKHPLTGEILHPGLTNHPDHNLWKRDYGGASGVFSMVLSGKTDADARKFVNALQFFGLGYSWGGYESLAVVVNIEDRTVSRKDYGGAIIRLQIGLENIEDLIADLERGFAALES